MSSPFLPPHRDLPSLPSCGSDGRRNRCASECWRSWHDVYTALVTGSPGGGFRLRYFPLLMCLCTVFGGLYIPRLRHTYYEEWLHVTLLPPSVIQAIRR